MVVEVIVRNRKEVSFRSIRSKKIKLQEDFYVIKEF